MGPITKIHKWKQTRLGQIVTGLAEAGLAYIFASKAIDTGSWWHYLLTAIFVVGALHNLAKAIRNHGGK